MHDPDDDYRYFRIHVLNHRDIILVTQYVFFDYDVAALTLL